ncbi:MAG TPA: hypothetical protein VGD43_04170, partial [Micromonospora sp.]
AVAAMESEGVTPAPTGSQGLLAAAAPPPSTGGGLTDVQQTAIALIAASVLLVLLALGLATTALRRRLRDTPEEDAPVPGR